MKGNKHFKQIDRLLGIPAIFILGVFSKLRSFLFGNKIHTLSVGDRVVVVKLSALGDTFILLPIFKALKEKIGPTGKILMIATTINQAALKNFPYVDDVLILDFAKIFKNPLYLFSFLKTLRQFKAKFALDFDQWLRISPLLCFASGASRRFGFKTPEQHRHFLFQKTVLNDKSRHEFEQFAAIADLVGVKRSEINEYNGFFEKENLYKNFTVKQEKTKTIVHIHPGCGAYGWQRAWPENYYAELIKKLHFEMNVQIRMTGMGAYEENLITRIIADAGVPVDNRSGKLALEQLSDLLREADLVICGNTGILHLAAGLGRRILTMNGPANSQKWGPIGPSSGENAIRLLQANIHCSPCTTLGFEYGCQARPCMESISVEQAWEQCVNLL